MTRTTHWLLSTETDRWKVWTKDRGTQLPGSPLGRLRGGGDFVFDPFDAYQAGLVTSPNVVILGAIGTGKSTLVKMLVARGHARGHRSVVIDPKGEYGAVARACGGEVLTLRPGGPTWCNPFGSGLADNVELTVTLVEIVLERSLSPEERHWVDDAWRSVPPASLRPLRDVAGFAGGMHPHVTAALMARTVQRFVSGDLAGMFDGDSEESRLDATVNVIDVSALWQHRYFAVAAVALMAVAQRNGRGQGYVVVDEAWAVLADSAAIRWLHGEWKLARHRGTSHILVLHRWSDIDGVSDDRSRQRAWVNSMMRDCDTAFLFRHAATDVDLLHRVIDLSATERSWLPQLSRGSCVARFGRGRSVVSLTVSANEIAMTDTDERMRGKS